jgi:hypothetical protein
MLQPLKGFLIPKSGASLKRCPDTKLQLSAPAKTYAYCRGSTCKEDAGRSAESFDALRRRALLRGEVSE